MIPIYGPLAFSLGELAGFILFLWVLRKWVLRKKEIS
jgi:F0F1-type ATP synthase membrane subunit b/b'